MFKLIAILIFLKVMKISNILILIKRDIPLMILMMINYAYIIPILIHLVKIRVNHLLKNYNNKKKIQKGDIILSQLKKEKDIQIILY